ncbi:MAG: TetR/AcrR family transcriptional regulator [Hyphomicrobiaceae bacterium]
MESEAAIEPVPRPGGETAARILSAAEALFAEHGFEAVSMNAIATAAAVSKANIFHHFSSKKALYLAVLRDACRDSTEYLQELFVETGPLPERLANFTRKQLGSMFEHGKVTRLILRELLMDGERQGRDLAEKVFGDNFARLVEILRTGQARGELRADADPAMIATLLIGASVFFFESQEVLRHFRDVKFAEDTDAYSRMLVDILLRGILALPSALHKGTTP